MLGYTFKELGVDRLGSGATKYTLLAFDMCRLRVWRVDVILRDGCVSDEV